MTNINVCCGLTIKHWSTKWTTLLGILMTFHFQGAIHGHPHFTQEEVNYRRDFRLPLLCEQICLYPLSLLPSSLSWIHRETRPSRNLSLCEFYGWMEPSCCSALAAFLRWCWHCVRSASCIRRARPVFVSSSLPVSVSHRSSPPVCYQEYSFDDGDDGGDGEEAFYLAAVRGS